MKRKTIGVLVGAVAIYIGLDLYNTVPFSTEYPKTEYISDVPDAPLTKIVNENFSELWDRSAGIDLIQGSDAMSARLRMIRYAQKAIDVQYFLIKDDEAGALISLALLEAADRGVRVRFLMDDVFTTAKDKQIKILNAHPNVEVRYFNPLSRKVPKYLNYALDPGKSNRRMHNKSMTADGAFGIIGGRNIADEYYDLGNKHLFSDFDMLLIGNIVDDIGSDFDLFWNDEFSVPFGELAGVITQEQLSEIRQDLEKRHAAAIQSAYAETYESDYLDQIATGEVQPFLFEAENVVDTPDKLRDSIYTDQFYPVAQSVRQGIENAQSEVTIFTPYFVPQDWATDLLIETAQRGVDVKVITNSLVSNNHAYVHGGYYYRRKDLLNAGVELYEVRLDSPAILSGDSNQPELTMHTKLAFIDRETIFAGSFNFDPRSVHINTELWMHATQSEFAEKLLAVYEPARDAYAYKVELDENGDLIWIFARDEGQEILTREPAPFYKKAIAWVTRILPVEIQL